MEDHLQGKRYIGLVRCSTVGQADTSIDDQFALLRAFAARHGMVHVADIQLEGVTGSIPGARRDIDELVQRKQTLDDFEVLLVQDTTRLTRSGSQHGNKIEFDLAANGIQVEFVADNLPQGEYRELIKTLLYSAGKQHAKSIALTSSRGAMSALTAGRAAYCRRPPYAVDRLYLAPDGTPRYIIRLLPDGTQLQLDPRTREVIGRFERNEGRGAPRHYIKQKDERVELVPGADEHVSVVRRIYLRHFVDGWGAVRIARELNDQGIPSPSNGGWSLTTVDAILSNPIYLGLAVANRLSRAIYYERAPDTPKPIEIDPRTLAQRRRPPQRVRARAEWVEKRHEKLADLLPSEIRDLARQRHERFLDRHALGYAPKPDRDRHSDTEYLLKGILVSLQGGYAMTGRLCGTPPHRRRYYAVTRARTTPSSDRLLRRLVPAEPLENALIGLLQELLRRKDDIREEVRAAVKRYLARSAGTQDTEKLRATREAAKRRLEFAIENLDEVGREAARDVFQRLQAQVRAVEEELRKQARSPLVVTDVDQHAEAVAKKLATLSESIDTLPRPALRRLLRAFIANAVVDLETRSVEVRLRIPGWALRGEEPMCLDDSSPCKTGIEAHDETGMLILTPKLIWIGAWHCFAACDFGAAA